MPRAFRDLALYRQLKERLKSKKKNKEKTKYSYYKIFAL